MGFDLYGKNGNDFRANIWSWPSILTLIRETEILPDELCIKMSWNDGACVNAVQAIKLGDALQEKLNSIEGEVFTIHPTECKTRELGMAAIAHLMESGAEEIITGSPPNQVGREHLQEFIDFCKRSGGFEVH